MAPRSQSRRLDENPPIGIRPPLSLVPQNQRTNGEQTNVSFEDGAMKIDHPDGSTTINFDPQVSEDKSSGKFDANLAKKMDSGKLADIASDLLEGISRDEESRKDWLDTRTLGIALLGAKLEKPRTDTGLSGAPLEGMSTVRHPLLMEATVSFQATARAELLPAAGPVKVRNDAPPPPVAQGEDSDQTSAAQDISDSLAAKDLLSQALEKDMNHYLTYIASEYVPDTDRMLFYVGFGGDGFKKVYNCPIRRRPVSESVDAEDLIVSNHATDMHNSGRITHRIRMRESVLRRMQIMGVYRDIPLRKPLAESNPVKDKKEEVEGVTSRNTREKDKDYEIFETYTELDLDEFAPRKFKGKGLPLPYRVTLDKESKEILDIRRNWKEDDDECMAKRFFVQFPFIRGLGFYGFGFIHLIGNAANALTAAWREMLDAGMFNCFPGFIYAKGVGRQNTNQFRVPPGGGIGIEIPMQMSIKDALMPLPYKEPGASFTQFITHVEEVGRRLASTGNIQVGEGKQDAPVGTTLALIEQASKVMDSAHKRLHASQAEEFKLLKERFKEDPEAFWRHNRGRQTVQWKKDQFVEALNNCELVPVADPNNPTSLHRAAKALAIQQLAMAAPDLFDPQAVAMRIMKTVDIDPSGLMRATPAAPPPDPRMAAVQAKAQAEQMKNQIAQLTMQIKAAELQANSQDKAQERASREKIEQMKIQLELLRIKQEEVIHQNDMRRANAESQQEMQIDQQKHHQELQQNEQLHRQEMQHEQQMQHHNVALKQAEAQIKLRQASQDAQNSQQQAEEEARGGRIQAERDHEVDAYRQNLKLEREEEAHRAKMEREAETHESKLKRDEELNKAKVQVAKQLAKVQKSAKPKSGGTK